MNSSRYLAAGIIVVLGNEYEVLIWAPDWAILAVVWAKISFFLATEVAEVSLDKAQTGALDEFRDLPR